MASEDHVVVICGDGPTGLSCGLLLAKNGVTTHVVGKDQTPTHKALFHNYLGLPDTPGPEFIERAREQVQDMGGRLHDANVKSIERKGDRFHVRLDDGNTLEADNVVLANGRDTKLADGLGVAKRGDVVRIDIDGKTDVEGVYAGGWLARGAKIQAVISAGDGAAIALDILSTLKGKPFHDFDVLQEPPQAAGTRGGR